MKKYWIGPEGQVMEVEWTHIETVIASPERFGLARGQVEEEYRRSEESLGLEGKARARIIGGLLAQGWIRVRYDDIHDVWTFNLFDGCPAGAQAHIFAFLGQVLAAGEAHVYADIRLVFVRRAPLTSPAGPSGGKTLLEKWQRLAAALPAHE